MYLFFGKKTIKSVVPIHSSKTVPSKKVSGSPPCNFLQPVSNLHPVEFLTLYLIKVGCMCCVNYDAGKLSYWPWRLRLVGFRGSSSRVWAAAAASACCSNTSCCCCTSTSCCCWWSWRLWCLLSLHIASGGPLPLSREPAGCEPLPALPSNSLLPTLSQSPAVGVDGRSQPTPIVTGRPQNSWWAPSDTS